MGQHASRCSIGNALLFILLATSVNAQESGGDRKTIHLNNAAALSGPDSLDISGIQFNVRRTFKMAVEQTDLIEPRDSARVKQCLPDRSVLEAWEIHYKSPTGRWKRCVIFRREGSEIRKLYVQIGHTAPCTAYLDAIGSVSTDERGKWTPGRFKSNDILIALVIGVPYVVIDEFNQGFEYSDIVIGDIKEHILDLMYGACVALHFLPQAKSLERMGKGVLPLVGDIPQRCVAVHGHSSAADWALIFGATFPYTGLVLSDSGTLDKKFILNDPDAISRANGIFMNLPKSWQNSPDPKTNFEPMIIAAAKKGVEQHITYGALEGALQGESGMERRIIMKRLEDSSPKIKTHIQNRDHGASDPEQIIDWLEAFLKVK